MITMDVNYRTSLEKWVESQKLSIDIIKNRIDCEVKEQGLKMRYIDSLNETLLHEEALLSQTLKELEDGR